MASALLVSPPCLRAEFPKIRIAPGTQHGFLVLRNLSGTILASGDYMEMPTGERMKVRVVFHFRDGSLDDETTIYARRTLRLISNRHIQRGPTFPEPIDFEIDIPGQRVSLRALSNGKEVVTTEPMDLPADLANGILFDLILNLPPDSPKVEVPYLAPGVKPRMVKLAISPETEEPFKAGGRSYKAMKYVVKVNLGGLTGVIAPMIGKQPVDTHVWIMRSFIPSIVRVDGAIYNEGPVWSLQLASPTW